MEKPSFSVVLGAILSVVLIVDVRKAHADALDIGTLGGTTSRALGVENGMVIGWSTIAGDEVRHAFVWTQEDGMVDLGTFGGDESMPSGIDNGMVVGCAGGSNGISETAFAWTRAAGKINLGTLGGLYSYAYGVSNGQVVGGSCIHAGMCADGTTPCKTDQDCQNVPSNQRCWELERAFSWTAAGGMVNLGTLGGNYSGANAVDNGQVVGSSQTSAAFCQGSTTPCITTQDCRNAGFINALCVKAWHAFIWTAADGMRDLGTLGGTDSRTAGIRNGQVIGYSSTSNNLEHHAFIWTAADGMRDLGTLGGTSSYAQTIDSDGTVVGVSTTLPPSPFIPTPFHVFSWTQSGGMVDLNVSPGGQDSDVKAADNGQVVGSSDTDTSGSSANTLSLHAGLRAASSGGRHAYSWKQATGASDLGTLGGSWSEAFSVHKGQVAGVATNGTETARAVLWNTCQTCPPAPQTCPPAPQTCRVAQKSLLRLVHNPTNGTRNALTWKWKNGQATNKAEFGSPNVSTDYALCIYTGASPTLLLKLRIFSDAKRWRDAKNGYSFAGGRRRAIKERIGLGAGIDGEAHVAIHATGANLPNLTLGGIVAPITVQMLNSDTSVCWGSEFNTSNIVKNDATRLLAKTPR